MIKNWKAGAPVESGGHFYPPSDDLFDLGIIGLEWRDLRIDGKAYIDELGEDMVIGDTFSLLTGVATDDLFAIKSYDGAFYVTLLQFINDANPFFTLGGETAFKLKFDPDDAGIQFGDSTDSWDVGLFYFGSTSLAVRNAADSAFAGLRANVFTASIGLVLNVSGAYITGIGTDDSHWLLKTKQNTVGDVEVARAQGAADPYFSIGGSQEFKFYNSGTALFGAFITSDATQIEIGAGGVIKSGATNTDTMLLKANDTTFITFTTAATDVCTMDAITMSGTWLASGTVILPAFTLSGTVTLGGQVFDAGSGSARINTTGSQEGLHIHSTQDDTIGALLQMDHISASPAADDWVGIIYWRGRDSGNNITNYGYQGCRIVNPVDGAEDGKYEWVLANAGSPNYLAMTLSGAGVLWIDSDFTPAGNIILADTKAINTGVVDDDYYILGAVENAGNTILEVARVAGGADPFFSIGTGKEFTFFSSGKATFAGIVTMSNTKAIHTGLIDNDYFDIGAVDNDTNTITNLLRFQGAVDPYVQLTNGLYMVEQAAAHADIAGHSQLWIKNLQGTVPIITGDTGLDAAINRTIFVGTADHTNNTSTAEQTLIPTGVGTVTIPANTFAVGNNIRVIARGIYGSKATGAGTLTFRVKFGATVLGTFVETLSNNETNQSWELSICLAIRSTGGSGTVFPQGRWLHKFVQGGDVTGMGAFNVTAAVTIDTTGALVLDITDQFSVSDVANTITVTNLVVELMN